MESIKKNLQYIKNNIKAGKFHSDKPLMEFVAGEVVQMVRVKPFQYKIPYIQEKHRSHMETFRNYGEKYKSKLLSDVQEIQRELYIPRGNQKRILKLITEILASDLHRKDVQRLIDSSTAPEATKIEKITCK